MIMISSVLNDLYTKNYSDEYVNESEIRAAINKQNNSVQLTKDFNDLIHSVNGVASYQYVINELTQNIIIGSQRKNYNYHDVIELAENASVLADENDKINGSLLIDNYDQYNYTPLTWRRFKNYVNESLAAEN